LTERVDILCDSIYTRVWYTDSNAIVRQRVAEAIVAQRAPLLAEIVRQGIDEGAFTTPSPEQAGEVFMARSRSSRRPGGR
jgi:hypothetical protein